jgi:hypothetical protein
MMLSAVFTLDVGGKPTLSFEAKNLREAWEICHEEWLKADLARICSNGVPLWDGKARLRSRCAAEAEAVIYRLAAQQEQTAGDLILAYLVELDVGTIEDATPA